MQMPMGWLVDRYGVKWPYSLCFVLWGIAAAATGAVTTLSALIVMRLLIGVAESVVVPATYRYLANNFEDAERHRPRHFSIGGKMGPALGALIAAWMIVTYSWHVMFVATGLVGLIWLVPWLLMVRNDYPSKEELAAAIHRASSVTANTLTLCKLTLIPKQAVGLNTGLQQVATSLAGGVSASLSGWLLHIGGSYELPLMAIFGFLLVGATSTLALLQRKWAPKVNDIAPLELAQTDKQTAVGVQRGAGE